MRTAATITAVALVVCGCFVAVISAIVIGVIVACAS